MKKKIICLCTICIFMILCTACGKEKNLSDVSFSDNKIYLGETKEQLKKIFGNFYVGDAINDEEKGTVTVSLQKDKINYIASYDKNTSFGGIRVGDSIKEVSKKTNLKESYIGNNRSISIFYNSKNKIIFKTRDFLFYPTDNVPDQETSYDNLMKTNYHNLKHSKYMVRITIEDGKTTGIQLFSTKSLFKYFHLPHMILKNGSFNLNSINKEMLQNEADESSEFDNYIISESSVYEKGWDVYDLEIPTSDDDENDKGVDDYASVEIQVSKQDHRLYIESSDPRVVLNGIFYNESKHKVLKTLGISEEWGSGHDDIFLAFDKDGQLLKKNNNGSKFLDDSNSSVPPLTAFHMHLIFRNNKLAQLALLRY